MSTDVSDCFDSLIDACRDGNPTEIISIFKQCPDLESHHNLFMALSESVQNNNASCITALYQCFPRIDVNMTDIRDKTALMYAATNGYVECISCLQHFSHLDPNIQDISGRTALMMAVESDQPTSITALHAHFPLTDPNVRHVFGYTALTWAACKNRANCINALHECFPNLDPNLADKGGHSPLIWSSQLGFDECICALAKFPSINANHQDDEQSTALMHAAIQGHYGCIEALCLSFPNIDADIRDVFGRTPLICAAKKNNPAIITCLKKYFPNINPNASDDFGLTALMGAVDHQCIEVIFALHSCFADIDPNLQDAEGYSAIMWSASHTISSKPLVVAMTECFPGQIDINLKDKYGRTALMIAVYMKNSDYILELHRLFPNLDWKARDHRGRSGLVFAVINNLQSELSTLLELFASPNF